MARAYFAFLVAISLMVQAFCAPTNVRFREPRDTSGEKDTDYKDNKSPSDTTSTVTTTSDDREDSDEDDDFKPTTTSNGGGSSIGSLLNLASALLPSLSGSNNTQRSGESSSSPLQPFIGLKMDIFRALLQFGTSLIGLASSANTSGS